MVALLAVGAMIVPGPVTAATYTQGGLTTMDTVINAGSGRTTFGSWTSLLNSRCTMINNVGAFGCTGNIPYAVEVDFRDGFGYRQGLVNDSSTATTGDKPQIIASKKTIIFPLSYLTQFAPPPGVYNARVRASFQYCTNFTYSTLSSSPTRGGCGPVQTVQLQSTIFYIKGSASTPVVTDTYINPVTATEAAPFSGQLATFTNSCVNCVVSAVVDWGDGTAPTTHVATTGATPGQGILNASHTYANQGAYRTRVSFSAKSSSGVPMGFGTVTATGTATVDDAPLIASEGGTYFTGGTLSYSGEIGRFTDANPISTDADYQVLISWGDGSTSLGSAARDGSQFVVQGAHTYGNAGTYNVSFKIRSTRGQEATGHSTITASLGGGG